MGMHERIKARARYMSFYCRSEAFWVCCYDGMLKDLGMFNPVGNFVTEKLKMKNRSENYKKAVLVK